MQQNTEEWHQMRAVRLGASDSPIVLGISPWKTAFQLWEQKTGLVVVERGENMATMRGHNLESIARKHYELETSLEAPPKVVVHPTHQWLMASLDGYNKKNSLVVEVKCPGKEAHELAKQGKIPEYYYPQVQHQMFCAEASMCHYYSFDGENGVLVHVPRNDEYLEKEWFPAVSKFWDMVQTKTPPPLTDKDYKTCTNQEVCQLVSDYAHLKKQIEELQEKADLIKLSIFTKIDHPRMQVGKAKLITSYRKGNVNYSDIPELKSVDLEKYRKPPIKVETIKV